MQSSALVPSAESEYSRINDPIVPYITGAIELDDPFMDYESVHTQVLVSSIYSRVVFHFLMSLYTVIMTRNISLSSMRIVYHLPRKYPFLPRNCP